MVRMNRLVLLVLLVSGCATTRPDWYRSLHTPAFAKLAAGEVAACGGSAEACFARGNERLGSSSTFDLGVKNVTTACVAGSRPACDLLDRRASPPPSTDDLRPPFPTEAYAHHETGASLVLCSLSKDGVLSACQAVSGPPIENGELVRWANGKHLRPFRFDGKPFASKVMLQVILASPDGGSPHDGGQAAQR